MDTAGDTESSEFNPVYINKYNRFRVVHFEAILTRFLHWLTWKPNETILDIGCGTGDLSYKYIYPLLLGSFKKFVCADVSPRMITEAEKRFQGKPKVSFQQLDITKDLEKDQECTYNRVFSIYCVTWLSDQKKAFENVYKLLKPSGECFVVLIRRHGFFESTIFELGQKPKWNKFFQKHENYSFHYRNDPDPIGTVKNLMASVGFVNVKVEFQDSTFGFKDRNEFLGFFKALPNPFNQMTTEQQQDYETEAFDLALKNNLIGEPVNNTDKESFLVIYGQKM
ncbi:Methyltransf_25 domain-containing protein [Sergentomyia squamirostris]